VTAPAARGDALRALAGLLRGGLSLRQALISWPEEAPPPLQQSLERVARRVMLGADVDQAVTILRVDFGEDLPSISSALGLHLELGGNLAALLDRIATAIDVRQHSLAAAEAAGSGARLSGRLVAGLPLAFVPLAPVGGMPWTDPRAFVSAVAGVVLAVFGMRWMARLVPGPPRLQDGVTMVAELLAGALDAGASLAAALQCLTSHPPEELEDQLVKAADTVALGASWPDSLQRLGHPGLAGIALTVRRAEWAGAPIGGALELLAERRRESMLLSFERSLRRVPVLMVVPLVVCMLPAYLLIAAGPWLHVF
jgi:tight adherence protein B